jgi:DNA polymerase III alpha subunit (gram-positive type)
MAWDYVLFDIETDGLKPKHIHMMCMTDLVTWENKTLVGLDEVTLGIQMLDEAKMIVGHAINYFDCPVVEAMTENLIKLPRMKCVDTLEMSKHLCPEMRAHGLKEWGAVLGLPKLEQPNFDAGFTEEWIPYCERDVELNCKVFLVLLEKLFQRYPEELPHKWQALREYMVAA